MNQLTCEKLLFGGFGMARTDKGVVFVEGLLPGETGSVEPLGKKGGIPFFATKEVIEKSSARRDPQCPYFGECGGCNWLHYEYQSQLDSKVAILEDALRRIGKIESYPAPEIFSAEEIGYRQRAQFKIDPSNKKIGFFKRGSNEIINIEKCPLLTENLNTLLKKKELILSHKIKKNSLKLLDLGDKILSSPTIEGATEYFGTMQVGKYHFSVKGDSFFQSNHFLIEAMGNWCQEEMVGENLLDLFGGVGLFSLFHGSKFKNTTLVEIEANMVKEAKAVFKANGLTSANAVASSAEKFFHQAAKHSFDTIIVDPPRPGLSKDVRKGIAKLAPTKLLYISCNPTTQARDVGYFVNTCGYEIKKSALFDLYPNTHHMETGIFLTKE